MERLPIAQIALAFAFGLLAFGLWAAVNRLLRKSPAELSPLDRLFGTMMLGRYFGPLHARLHARGYRLGLRDGFGRLLASGIVAIMLIGFLIYGHVLA